MPNYNIVVNTSNFKPFSFQEKIAPLLMYNQSYDQLNEKLEKYAEDYGSIPETNDTNIDSIVNDYNNRLRELSDRFANGMTNSVGNDLRKMFIEGKQKLTPIKQAISDYNDYVDKVEKLGPDAIFKKQYNIGDFYNKQRSPLEYKSASDIQKQAKDYFTGVANLYSLAPKIIGSLGSGYDLIKSGNPFDSDDVMNIILQGASSDSSYENAVSQEVVKGLNTLYANLGVDGYDSSAQKKIKDNIALGLMQAIKAPDYDTQRREKPDKPSKTDKESMDEYIGRTLAQNGYFPTYDDNGNFALSDEDYNKYKEIMKSSRKPGTNGSELTSAENDYDSSITGEYSTEELKKQISKSSYNLGVVINGHSQNLEVNDIAITNNPEKDPNNIQVFIKNEHNLWKQQSLNDTQKSNIVNFIEKTTRAQREYIEGLKKQSKPDTTMINIYEKILNYRSNTNEQGGKLRDVQQE